jgi:antitoxin ParD1/3/4
MTVELTPTQTAFIQQAVATGRYAPAEDAVTEALLLWEERERQRAELLASLDEAEAALDRGEGIPLTPESMQALAEDVKQRGRDRMAAERHSKSCG